MNDTIYRQEAIGAMRKLRKWNVMLEDYKNEGFSYDDVMFTLEKLPPAQPQRKTGKWITVNGRLGDEVECNQCHSVFWYWMGNYSFCPSCGARMEGDNL